MWGNTQVLQVPNNTGTTPMPVSGQLARISYARPETWHWVFASRLLDGSLPPIPAAFVQVDVFFDLTIGIGRSMLVLEGFEHHSFYWNFPLPVPVNQLIYSTQVDGPRKINDAGSSLVTAPPNPVNQISAQDIQCNCRVLARTSGGALEFETVEVSAHFAPKTHLRPEWHNKQFPGAEDGGGTSAVGYQMEQLSGRGR